MKPTPETNPTEDLDSRIERLDHLIDTRDDGVRGLGVRLALGLAKEIREGSVPGTKTQELVAGWMQRFGSDIVEEAISQARVLLSDPSRLAEEFRRRIEPPKTPVSDEPAGEPDSIENSDA